MTLMTGTVRERLSKSAISKALRTGAVKSLLYSAFTSPIIDWGKKWLFKGEEEECTCAD